MVESHRVAIARRTGLSPATPSTRGFETPGQNQVHRVARLRHSDAAGLLWPTREREIRTVWTDDVRGGPWWLHLHRWIQQGMPCGLRESSFPRGEPRVYIVEQLFAWPSPFWARLLPCGFPQGEQLKVCSSPRMRRADIEVPNLPVAVDARGRSACYPRGSFYPLSPDPSTRGPRIT